MLFIELVDLHDYLPEFLSGYLHALAFTGDPNPPQGEYPEPRVSRFSRELIRSSFRDCLIFLDKSEHLFDLGCDWSEIGPLAGAAFWCARNGHGCGFWDGDWPEHGDDLALLARTFGEVDVFVVADTFGL